MAIPSLLGSYIDQTYPRLVQTSGSEFADGLGNPISIGISGGTNTYIPLWSGSNALTSSFLNQSNNTLKATYNSVDNGLILDISRSMYYLGDFGNVNSECYLQLTPSQGFMVTSDSGDYPSRLRLDHNIFSTDVRDFDDNYVSQVSQNSTSIISKVFDDTNTPRVFTEINQTSSSIALSGSVTISGSATLNNVTLEPTTEDNINLSSAAYTITSWGVYRIITGDNTYNYNLNLPDPTLFPGREICLINSDQTNQFQFGTNAPYKLSGTTGWSLMDPNIMMILKSIGGKWIGPKIPES
jgi:hypothetical protein